MTSPLSPVVLASSSLWLLTVKLWVDVPEGAGFHGEAAVALPQLNVSVSLPFSVPPGQAQAVTLCINDVPAMAWWPRAWAPEGQPVLYNLTSQLSLPGSGVIADRTLTIGFRTVELLQVKHVPL